MRNENLIDQDEDGEADVMPWMMSVCRPPQPDCEFCRLAQSLGQVVYCRCMTQAIKVRAQRDRRTRQV